MEPFVLDHDSPFPASLQLAAQVRLQVMTGLVPAAGRIPSVRELAAEHRLNRNTVAKVLAQLAEEGWIEGQQGRGFFAGNPPASRSAPLLRQLVTGAVRQADKLGVPAPVLAQAILAHGALTKSQPQRLIRLVLVGVARSALTRLKTALEASLPVSVEAVFTDDLAHLRPESADLVTATMFAQPETQAWARGSRIISLVPQAAQAAWQTLLTLPAGTSVLAASADWVEAARIRRALAAAGASHLNVELAASEALPGALGRAHWALAPAAAARALQGPAAGPRLLLEPAELTPALMERVRRHLPAETARPQQAAPSPWF